VVKPREQGGAGLDASWDDGLRSALRDAVRQASWSRDAFVDMDRIAANLYPPSGSPAAWRSVRYIESHDEVRFDRGPRIAALGDPSDPTSWYAASRARVVTGILLTAPGIPMLFMGEEILESTPWTDDIRSIGNIISWDALEAGEKTSTDFLRFVQELLRIRREQPALGGEAIHVHHVDTRSRIIAFHRWLEGVGRDVVVVASLNESTQFGYRVGMPRSGAWREVHNSDAFHNWPNPGVAGNGGAVWADTTPMHAMPASAAITIPANSILLFT
jgi:1,4-alpha-glucan branching enzyme